MRNSWLFDIDFLHLPHTEGVGYPTATQRQGIQKLVFAY
jgi:hypothetical protein